MRKPITLAVAVIAATLFVAMAAHAAVTGTWIGPTNSAWSNTAAWQGGVVPNGQGDTAQYSGTSSQITLQDIAAGVTVGTLKVDSTSNISWQFTPNNNIFLNQDGGGPLSASVINNIQSTGATSNPAIFLNAGTGGTFVLQDNLFISNTSNSTRTTGSVQIRGPITGAGNIYIENVSNNIGAGQVAFTNNQSTGFGGFGGNVTIAKGATTFSRGDVFTPSPGNFVTIGDTGKGDATLAFVSAALGNIENNFVVAAGTGGTSVFGDSATSTGLVNIKSTNSFAANVTLNGDVSISALGTGIFQIGDPIVGVGKITKIGSGPMRVTNANSYSGGTVVSAGTLSVGHTDAINNGFGFYVATDGTLGAGNVTVDSTATNLEIESSSAAINVIADNKTLSLAGGGTAGLPDQGYALLDAGINETVGGLVLGGVAQTTAGTYGSSSSGATFQNDEYFSGSGMITLAPAGLPGDFNSDGKVDAGDYATWRKNEVANAALPNDNGAGNQAARFALWRANFGKPPGAGAGLSNAQVPEPGTLLLVVAGALLAYTGRRSR